MLLTYDTRVYQLCQKTRTIRFLFKHVPSEFQFAFILKAINFACVTLFLLPISALQSGIYYLMTY